MNIEADRHPDLVPDDESEDYQPKESLVATFMALTLDEVKKLRKS